VKNLGNITFRLSSALCLIVGILSKNKSLRNNYIFGLNKLVFFESSQNELECSNLEVKFDNCSILEGNADELFLGRDSTPTCFVKSDVNRNALIHVTFMTRKPVAELGIKNFRGDKSSSYGIKGLIIILNSVSIFSGDLSQNTGTSGDLYSLRLFISQPFHHSSNKHLAHKNHGQKSLANTGLAHKRPEELPSLVKHKSQDISVSSQQSDTSSGKVGFVDQIRKHPRVASSINNLFKFGESKNSERSKSSQRARIVDRSNKLQSESNYLSLFSKLYYPLERKKTDGGSLIRDISNTEDNLLSNRTMAEGDKGFSYGQGLTDYGLPPHPSRKSLYMVDLLKRNLSTTVKTSTTDKKNPSKSRGPLVERISFVGDFAGPDDKSPKENNIPELRTSFGGLKIFQKVSEDIIHKKNGPSLRTSFSSQNQWPKSVVDLLGGVSAGAQIPELPEGSKLKIALWSNWGDPEE
jgi:hypothetical protein